MPPVPPYIETPQQLYNAILALLGQDSESINKNLTDVQTNLQLGINAAVNTTATDILRSTGQTNLNINSSANSVKAAITTSQNNITGSIASNSNAILLNIFGSKNEINNRTTQEAQTTRNQVGQTGQNIVDRLTGSIAAANAFVVNATNVVGQGINDAIGVIGEKINGITTGIGDAIGDAIGGIGDWLENFWANIFLSIDQVGAKLNHFWEQLASDAKTDIGGHINRLANIVEKVKNGQYTSWQALERDLEGLNVNTGIITGVLSLLQIVPIMLQISGASVKPFTDHIDQLANENSRGNLLGAPDLLSARIRGTTSLQHLNDALGKQGYTAEDIQILIDTTYNLLDDGVLRILLLRGEIDEQTHDSYLRKAGYHDVDIIRLKLLYNVLPPINDLIRFAVREVYSPEITNKFGQFEDFPPAFANEAAKQGIGTEVAKQYWAAHWELPSPTQGFQMFHRGIIDHDTLSLLLRALDVMPYWRDRMIQLSYNPLTRVDVRRMYGLGVIGRDDVYKNYLAIGLSPDNATRLTEFTIRYESKEDESGATEISTLTRSVIITAYTRKQVTREVAKERLIALRYVAEDAELLLDIADYNEYIKNNPDRTREQNERLADVTVNAYKRKALSHDDALDNLLDSGYKEDDAIRALAFADLEYEVAFKGEIVNRVKSLYIENTYDNNEVQSLLANLDFTPPEIALFLDELMILKSVNTRKPTLAQFTSMLKKDIIDKATYISELVGLGYAEKYIDNMVSLAIGVEDFT